MTCDDARDMFSLLADDRLTPLERAALDAHLADCAECRRELAGFERTVKLVRAIDPAHAPAEFVDRVLAAAQSSRPEPKPAPIPQRSETSPKQSPPVAQRPVSSPPKPSAPTPQPTPTLTPPPPTTTPTPQPTTTTPTPQPTTTTPTPQPTTTPSPQPTTTPSPQPTTPPPAQPAPPPTPPTTSPPPAQPTPTPPPTQQPPLRERPTPLPERPAAPRRMRPWRTLPLGAAALLVIGGLAVLLFRGSPEQQRAAQRQLEAPPVVTSPAPPSEAPPAPAPSAPEPQKPAAPASKPAKTKAKPPTATNKRSETAGERKALPDEQRNVGPPQIAERDSAKVESSERAQDKDKRDIAQDRVAPASPSRERLAAAQKAQAPSQAAPLSRTGPATGIPAAAPDVTAQLRVADLRSGERALIALAARAGGRQTGRRVDAGRIVVELAVPVEAYPQFVRDAATLGSMSIERQDAIDRPMVAVAVTLSR